MIRLIFTNGRIARVRKTSIIKLASSIFLSLVLMLSLFTTPVAGLLSEVDDAVLIDDIHAPFIDEVNDINLVSETNSIAIIDQMNSEFMGIQTFSSSIIVPGGTLELSVSDWVGLEDAVASIPSGNIIINLTNDIIAPSDAHAIIIPAGVNVYLIGNGYSIYQDSTFVITAGNIGVGSYSFQRRHFIVDGSLHFDDITLTRSAGLTHRGGGILIRTGGHVEMFADAEISNNIATEYTPLTDNSTYNGGAVYAVGTGGAFIMHGGLITNNHTNHSGGGIAVWSNGAVIISDGVITNNTASWGAGLSVSGTDLTMYGGEISNNNASMGGGIYLASSSIFTMYNGEIIDNHAISGGIGSGGGIYSVGSNIIMHDGLISDNTAGEYGGGVDFRNSSPSIASIFTMYGGEISNNHVTSLAGWNLGGGGVSLYRYVVFNMHGGGINDNTSVVFAGGVYVWDATFNIFDDAVVSNNAGAWGGGVTVLTTDTSGNTNSSTLVMNGGEIRGNTATDWGGGILVFVGSGTVGSTFIMNDGVIGGENLADANTAVNGGGIMIQDHGTFTMNNGEIIGNNASASGGGVFLDTNNTSPFVINNGYISDNNATFGGGIFAGSSSVVTLGGTNATISGNQAASQGGGMFINTNASATINAGLIDDNQANLGGGILHVGALTVNNGTFSNNTALLNGGAIFAVNYGNLTTSNTVVFTGNTAAAAHDWFLHPDFATGIVPAADSGGANGGNTSNIQWSSVSILGAHALNSFDINFIGSSPLDLVTKFFFFK